MLTKEDIADAALAVGFEQLTLAAVADRLGVSHSALYRHITDREGLVAAALGRVVARTDWPRPTGDWRADLAAQAWTLWRLLEAHPGIERELSGLTRIPPEIIERFGGNIERLTGHGFPLPEAFLAVDTVFDLTIAQFVQSRRLPTRADAAGWGTAASPEITTLLTDALEDPPDLWFDRKLTLVLDGIAARHAGDPARLREET